MCGHIWISRVCEQSGSMSINIPISGILVSKTTNSSLLECLDLLEGTKCWHRTTLHHFHCGVKNMRLEKAEDEISSYESSHTVGRHLPRDVAQKVLGMKLTTWMLTRAAFCMVSSTVPFLPPSILTLPIPPFGVKTHFYQQRECFFCNWFGLLGKKTHKKTQTNEKSSSFQLVSSRIFYLVWRLVWDDFREPRTDRTAVNYSTISQSTSPADMKARAVPY